MRFVRTFLTLGFLLFGAAVLLLAVGGYLTATGRSVPIMRGAVQRFAALTDGQSTDQLALSVSVDPAARRLDGTARLRVKASGTERDRVYLLLNDGLSIEDVWAETESGERTPLRHYRLWLLAVVDLATPLADGETATLGLSYRGDPLSGRQPFGQRVVETDEVILAPTDLWYPTDMKSFFRADVEATLPTSLEVVHAGSTEVVTDLGSSRRTRWTTAHPVTGVALVAGRYTRTSIGDAGVDHSAFVAHGIDIDGERIVESMARVYSRMGDAYGAAAAARQSLFVSRRLRHALADGSGVVGLRATDFGGGDHGFAAIADGIARTWWGAAVGTQPTDPKSGSAWAIEGLAANAARLAVRDEFGADAEFRWRRQRSFDPTTVGTLANASFLHDEQRSRADGLRNKAAYVVNMLQERIGDDAFTAATRGLVERFRYRTVSGDDVRQAFATASGVDLDTFFAQWVDTISQVDLSLDPKEGGAELVNHQTVEISEPVEVWRVPPGGQPEAQKMALGTATPLGNAERIVVDPRALLADMYRANNVLPREVGLRQIARSQRGSWMIVEGEPHDWAPARIREIDDKGQTRHLWEFELGLQQSPRWSTDGTRVLAVEPPRGERAKLFALHGSDGTQEQLGHDTDVDGGASGIVSARKSRLLYRSGKESRELVRLRDAALSAPRISADSARVVYAAERGDICELHLFDMQSGADRILMTWPTPPVAWEWTPDGSAVYALLAGDWDRQLWRLPVGGTPRALVREAAAARALAISPDGKRVALAAQAKLDHSFERFEVFVIDPRDRSGLQHYTVSGMSVVDLAWHDDDTLLVIASDPTYSMVPPPRVLRKLELADGSVVDFP